jgi:glutaminyl-peptide cyclotransferase
MKNRWSSIEEISQSYSHTTGNKGLAELVEVNPLVLPDMHRTKPWALRNSLLVQNKQRKAKSEKPLLLFTFYFFLFSLTACQQQATTLTPQIINTYPHDNQAFTQGLVLYNGKFYESTGQYGVSSLREVDIKTGNAIRNYVLDSQYFAEGLALVGDKLIQITWKEGRAFVYDLATFNKEQTFSYQGEGWGLCYDGTNLYMSDGSATLYKRNPETFEVTGQMQVKQNGQTVTMLNELECVAEFVYANIWQTDRIVKINKKSGQVVTDIDASNLLSSEDRVGLPQGAVLNGIAYNPEEDTFYITGKLWPKLFEVKFVEK